MRKHWFCCQPGSKRLGFRESRRDASSCHALFQRECLIVPVVIYGRLPPACLAAATGGTPSHLLATSRLRATDAIFASGVVRPSADAAELKFSRRATFQLLFLPVVALSVVGSAAKLLSGIGVRPLLPYDHNTQAPAHPAAHDESNGKSVTLLARVDTDRRDLLGRAGTNGPAPRSVSAHPPGHQVIPCDFNGFLADTQLLNNHHDIPMAVYLHRPRRQPGKPPAGQVQPKVAAWRLVPPRHVRGQSPDQHNFYFDQLDTRNHWAN